VALCYQKGLCKKIFLFSGISGYTRNNVKEDKILAEINIQAQEFGIDLKDITRVAHAISGATTTPQFLNNFMREKGLKSASLYLPYYETRKFQFYFTRFLKPDIIVQVKPLESSYHHLLEQ
jgi:hypothetical protein